MVKNNITVPLTIGTKSSPWVRIGKKVIITSEIGIAQTEKFFHRLKVDSFNLKVINEKIKTAIRGRKYTEITSVIEEQYFS